VKTDPRSPALSERSRTFASIQHAAGALGLPVEAIRLAKHRGCSAFRPNGNVSERDLIEWFLVECREFWGELLENLEAELWELPQAAAEWRETPPRGLDLLDVEESVFQWLRLIHSEIPPCLLDGSATLPLPPAAAGELDAVERIFRPATFPLEVPAWRMDLSPFEVVQAHRVEFWQWSESYASDRPGANAGLPMPPKFLILSDQEAKASRVPIRHHEPTTPERWDHLREDHGTPRSLLDFLPPAAATAPPPRGEREQRRKGQRKPRATR
jgi:hypothetical protein